MQVRFVCNITYSTTQDIACFHYSTMNKLAIVYHSIVYTRHSILLYDNTLHDLCYLKLPVLPQHFIEDYITASPFIYI